MWHFIPPLRAIQHGLASSQAACGVVTGSRLLGGGAEDRAECRGVSRPNIADSPMDPGALGGASLALWLWRGVAAATMRATVLRTEEGSLGASRPDRPPCSPGHPHMHVSC